MSDLRNILLSLCHKKGPLSIKTQKAVSIARNGFCTYDGTLFRRLRERNGVPLYGYLVTVVFRFEWPFNWHTDIVCLVFTQFFQFNTDFR